MRKKPLASWTDCDCEIKLRQMLQLFLHCEGVEVTVLLLLQDEQEYFDGVYFSDMTDFNNMQSI
jgi:hypothetical protein